MRPSAFLTLLVVLVVEVTPVAASPSPHVARVRAADTRSASALAEGRLRSSSFRKVLQHIDQLDVIVYIEMQPLLRGRLGGRVSWVTATQDFRYVRISLNPELTKSQLVATLAHELQHVAEIGEAPGVVDTVTLSAHYRHIGVENRKRSEQWDTQAAQRTGEVVRRELAQTAGREGASR
jgi:hypothetical protein